jgi:hypothetical protein
MACMPCLRSYLWSRMLGRSVFLVAALSSGPVLAEAIPADFRGIWAPACSDPSAPRLTVGADSLNLSLGGRSHGFAGVEISRSWIGGARASGEGIWFLASRRPGSPFAFVAGAPQGAKGVMVLEAGHPKHGQEMKSLFGVAFRRCSSEGSAAVPAPAAAQSEPPAYVGLWARQVTWCSDSERTIRFTLRGTEEIESACDFDRIAGGSGKWSIRQTCHVEGTKTRSRMDISVEGDRMTLGFPDKKGSRTRVLRCR